MRIKLLLLFFTFWTLGWSQDSIDSSYEYDEDIAEELDSTVTFANEDDISIHAIDSTTPKFFADRFQSKYKSKEFNYKTVIAAPSLWTQFKDWLTRWLRTLFNLESSEKADRWFMNLVEYGSYLMIAFVIFLIIKAILKKEGVWIFRRTGRKQLIDYTEVSEDIVENDFPKLIESAWVAQDYRSVIRYHHLMVLQKLSQYNKINWDLNKTNTDYSYEIKDRSLRRLFDYNVYLYDYIWYGEFQVDKSICEQASLSFQQTLTAIR